MTLFLLLIADTAALAAMLLLGVTGWPAWLACGAAPVLLFMMWRKMVKPRQVVMTGMDLLASQEFNNRLARVGQPDADRIGALFNSLIDRLHEERTRLHEQNSFLAQLIEASPMGIAMMDFDSHITQVNPAFRTLAEIPADDDISGLTPDALPAPLGPTLASLRDGEAVTVRPGGSKVFRCYRLSFRERGFSRPFLMVESLTEEVLTAEREAYGKVIRLLAHEVNNTMGGLMTLLDILADEHSSDPFEADAILSTRSRCEALSRFINAYASVVRLPDPTLLPHDLCGVVEDMLPFLQATYSGGMEIDTDISESPAPVLCDTDMLSQVMVNLLKNSAESIRATGRSDGQVTISAGTGPQGQPRIVVADNGAGILPENSSRLFNPFFSTKLGGQGIGLTLVAEILRRHHTRFSLRTSPDDGLTRFTIDFPGTRP
ncbi:MAG: PAS domain-containing protein [Bacteroides sp.]|nr:PAS domain-containing protein [Bacteroides sp.]